MHFYPFRLLVFSGTRVRTTGYKREVKMYEFTKYGTGRSTVDLRTKIKRRVFNLDHQSYPLRKRLQKFPILTIV